MRNPIWNMIPMLTTGEKSIPSPAKLKIEGVDHLLMSRGNQLKQFSKNQDPSRLLTLNQLLILTST